jgi:hypothetical protein
LQPDEVAFSFRHWIASGPPGFTLRQLDMKSDRQFCLIALICASLGWAETRHGDSASHAADRARTRSLRAVMNGSFAGELGC